MHTEITRMLALARRLLRFATHVDKSLNWGREIVRETCGEVNLNDRSVIVDVGAGLGYDLALVKDQYPSATYHAIDYREDHRAHFEQQGIIFHAVDIETNALPLSSASVDFVIINQVLEHCKEIFRIIHEVSRVLRVGGHVLIGVPNLASMHNRILLAIGRQPTCIQIGSAHIRGFTHVGIESFILSTAPRVFTKVKFVGANFYPFSAKIASPLSKYFPSLSVAIFFVFRKTGKYSGEFLIVTDELETNFRISD